MADSLLAVAVAPLTAFVLAKLGEMSDEQRLTKLLDQAQKEVTFWKSCYEAQSLVCSGEELTEIKTETSRELTAGASARRPSHPSVRRQCDRHDLRVGRCTHLQR
jgi:hypothetical protein